MPTFRLATINVHQFRAVENDMNNVDNLVSILKPLNLSLLVAEEVKDGKDWKRFCQDLSLSNYIFGCSEYEHFGNGIASCHSIRSYANQTSSLSCVGGTRALLQCSLDGFENITFAVTHLDYLNEDDRLVQMNEFNPFKNNIDILIGDMNALTRDDYSDEYYKNIVAGQRERTRWETPRFDLTKLITDEWKYKDAFKLMNPQMKDEEVVTCAYGTRIDYIYVHPCINSQWKLTKCSIIDTKGATDHNIVFAEFKLT
ncbi:unnamed protein product [Adineta steineri]|uniref:Endonuclease/exonuclease/phosphatase domain-containing protein n=1 Tax=Adineta steineri TaxID=433720 RepID=A0A819UG51_9BILA|nr:unnamed protein product [Adineta steineri]